MHLLFVEQHGRLAVSVLKPCRDQTSQGTQAVSYPQKGWKATKKRVPSCTQVAPQEEYEHSEMLLYKAQLLMEAQQLGAALDHLDSCQASHLPFQV